VTAGRPDAYDVGSPEERCLAVIVDGFGGSPIITVDVQVSGGTRIGAACKPLVQVGHPDVFAMDAPLYPDC
jgi:hypothetical protein